MKKKGAPTSTTDLLTAIGTVATAAVAVGALIVTIWLAQTDRTTAATRLELEQERHEEDLVRADHLRYLLDTAEQYARYQASETHDGRIRAETQGRLKLLLRLLPKDNAILLKYQFGVDRTEKEERMLEERFPGGCPAPDQVPPDRVYDELADNADSISKRGKRGES